jgi:hypothetical protein
VLVHRRQFVLGPRAVHARRDWVAERLDNSTWLSACPELEVAWRQDADGARWALLGLAVETRDALPDPLEQIARARSAQVPDLYAGWAGRWLLVGPEEVHLDAAGLLGCFYAAEDDGTVWVSSSPALIPSSLPRPAGADEDSRRPRYEQGVSWFPPPQSRIPGVHRLLPSQALDFRTGDVRPRALVPTIERDRGYGDTMDLLAASIVTAFRRLRLDGSTLWVSLSAGADSRTVLAAAHRAGVDISTFTRVLPRVPVGDRLIPPRLARQLCYGHVHLRARRRQPGRWRLVCEHSGGHVSEGDAQPVVTGVRDALVGISAGGECFPVFDGATWGRWPSGSAAASGAHRLEAIAQAFGEPPGTGATDALAAWLTWVDETPHAGLDWRDRFAIEQHLAGWQSSKEQVYDLLRVRRFFALNSARNYELMLSMSEDHRRESRPQKELIRRLAPELLEQPFNPADRDFGLLRAAAIRSRDDPLYAVRAARKALRRPSRSR